MTELGLWLGLLVVLLAANVLGLRSWAKSFGLRPLSLTQSVAAVALVAGLFSALVAAGLWLGPRAPIPWYATAPSWRP